MLWTMKAGYKLFPISSSVKLALEATNQPYSVKTLLLKWYIDTTEMPKDNTRILLLYVV